MNLGTFFAITLVCLIAVNAEWVETWIKHDAVIPWDEQVPDSISDKAAVKFKPQLYLTCGCDPYPVVNYLGQTSGGLKATGNRRGKCKGSGHGSQVYGRSAWHNDRWAIMYSWYFPKDSPSSDNGHRHDWEHVIIWIDNPDIENPTILGAATSSSSTSGYIKYSSLPANRVEGTAIKVDYYCSLMNQVEMQLTELSGGSQALIMWDQMTDDARQALNTVSFGKVICPFNDANFVPNLDKAWPFA